MSCLQYVARTMTKLSAYVMYPPSTYMYMDVWEMSIGGVSTVLLLYDEML